MYKFLKKHICSICLMLIFSAVFFLNPVETKAGPSDMEIVDGGVIEWHARSSNQNGKSGYKFYTKYWNFTIDKEGVPVKTVKVYQGSGGYTVESESWWEGGDLKTDYTYNLPVSTLEAISGICLTNGYYEITANAAMGFHELDANGNPTSYVDSGTYDTQDEFWTRCKQRPYWMSDPEHRYTGYFGKDVKQEYFYITVVGDAGIATTNGSGWYKRGTSMTASGTAKHGYTYNGNKTITVTKNDTVTLTTTPWQHTVAYDPAGGSPTPNSFTKLYGTAATITNVKPSKPGYTFVNWKSSVTGTIYNPGDSYTHSQNGGTDTLVAQREENSTKVIL